MADTQEDKKARPFRFLRWNWLLGNLIRPRETISKI